MKSAVKTQTNKADSVQLFSSLAQMKFKPYSQKGARILADRKAKLVKSKTQENQLYDPLCMVLQADRKIQNAQPRRLKFLVNLSPEHFLVGNENQIDMVGFGGIVHGFVDTDYYWSLSLKGPIENISVDSKKCIFIVLSETTLYFYHYNIKSKDSAELITQLIVKEGVKYMRFLRDALLGIFYNNSFEIYNIENLRLIKKKLDKVYPIDKTKKLLTIPSSIDYIINVFFQEPKQNKQSFILWCLEINFSTQQIKTRPIYRVYDIMNHAKGNMSIHNYNHQIIFMNLNHQIMAIKNGYLIDTVNLSAQQDSDVLKFMHPNIILHITKKNVGLYSFAIDMTVKPQKIVLKSIDSIQISSFPQNAFYISILKAFKNNFAIFFEDSAKKKIQTRGEISYYFQISQQTTFKEKISSLFDSIGRDILNPEVVNQKYNVALKMGLTERQIYLQLWDRSGKNAIQDYQYLLSTKNYKTIKQEIEKKLKKQSMLLRQVLKIEQSCHEINQQLLESPDCSEQNIQDFVTSHFFMKKLNLYKQLMILQRFSVLQSSASQGSSELKQIKIDIQKYHLFKKMDVKVYLIEQISDLLFSLKNNAKMIRMTIRDFKFVYRLVYRSILQDIIVTSKENLMDLLNQLPQLLPYFHQDLTEEEMKEGYYEGIWGPIESTQWEQQLYPNKIETIYNKTVVIDFIQSVWYKRFWLTAHGLASSNKEGINQINQMNNSEQIFYFFISKLYQHSRQNKPYYYKVIEFLEEKYELFPAHLKSKALLYENLYIYYFHEEQNNPSRLKFQEFLNWEDQLLFSYFFQHEKLKKNSLLREIKPIYEQSDANGSHLFNLGLFSYFYSDKSQISDLKFILNRINNEKAEFHINNRGIYEVLLKSIQLKMRLGSDQDVPMEQIMIYVRNILLSEKSEELMGEISIMEGIEEEAKLFQNMKINMTIKEIMDNFQAVMNKIIRHFINQKNILTTTSYQMFRGKSIEILKEAEKIKNKIYFTENHPNYNLLVFCSFILQDQILVEKVLPLLEDEDINHLYTIKRQAVQNIVLYMFKWSFSRSSQYKANEKYIKNLLDLLPSDNQCRLYLEAQLQIGIFLSSPQYALEYPLSKTSAYPNTKDIIEVFKRQNADFLINLDLQRLHELLQKLATAIHYNNKERLITLHKLYQLLIVQLLQKRQFITVISFIYQIIEMDTLIQNIGIIYVAIYIFKTVQEFNEESKKAIFKLLALYFDRPLALMKIIQKVIVTEQTGLQQSQYLKSIINNESSKSNFNYHSSSILRKQFTAYHQDPNSKAIVETYRQYLKSRNTEQYERGNEYDIIFTMLCHQPYFLIKFIELEKEHLTLKYVFTFIMMTISRSIFQRRKSYEVMKRVFSSLTMSSKEIKSSDELMMSFQAKSTDQEFQLPKLQQLNNYEFQTDKMARLVARAQGKLSKQKIAQTKQKALLQIREAIKNPTVVEQDIFEVEDQEKSKIQNPNKDLSILLVPKAVNIQFDGSKDKQLYFFRTQALPQFLEQLYGSPKSIGEFSLIKKRSAAPIISVRSFKDVKYQKASNLMLQRLYSHKVLLGSQINQEDDRQSDESFLNSFLPKPDIGASQQSQNSNLLSRNASKSRDKNSRTSKKDEVPLIADSNTDGKLFSDHIQNGLKDYKGHISINSAQRPTELQTDKFEMMREYLINSYNEMKIPKFQLGPLDKQLAKIGQTSVLDQQGIAKRKEQFLQRFLTFLYKQPVVVLGINMKLMEQIGRKHPESGLNVFFLQAYQRTLATHDKHGLQMTVTDLLPAHGLFVKSKDIIDLYKDIQSVILAKTTDQNIFKLSKLIALGFRKSVVEQEILFNYLKTLAMHFVEIDEEGLQRQREKVRRILQKLHVQVLIEKGEELFKQVSQGQRKKLLIQLFLDNLRNKSYNSAARQLQSKLS